MSNASKTISTEAGTAPRKRLPPWFRVQRAGTPNFLETKLVLRSLRLHSVCEEARCPNIGECFSHKTATFMLLGDTCTRGCHYCAVGKGKPNPVDQEEPAHVAEAVMQLGLKHVVLTSVDRDDLADGGAGHFARAVQAIKEKSPETKVEVLTPDFRGLRDRLKIVLESQIDVFNHNTETVPRLYPEVRGGGRYSWTMDILKYAKALSPKLPTKTGLMLGLGEERAELLSVFKDLRTAQCEILTLGQYLQPTPEQRAITRFIAPEEFSELREIALAMGFRHVESGPLVRSSYHAWSHLS